MSVDHVFDFLIHLFHARINGFMLLSSNLLLVRMAAAVGEFGRPFGMSLL